MTDYKNSFGKLHVYSVTPLPADDPLPFVRKRVASIRNNNCDETLSCVRCGIKGTHVVSYRQRGEPVGVKHRDLFSEQSNGTFVLMTKDHILPVSRGGNNKTANMQLMCGRCNSVKGNVVSEAEWDIILDDPSRHVSDCEHKRALFNEYFFSCFGKPPPALT